MIDALSRASWPMCLGLFFLSYIVIVGLSQMKHGSYVIALLAAVIIVSSQFSTLNNLEKGKAQCEQAQKMLQENCCGTSSDILTLLSIQSSYDVYRVYEDGNVCSSIVLKGNGNVGCMKSRPLSTAQYEEKKETLWKSGVCGTMFES